MGWKVLSAASLPVIWRFAIAVLLFLTTISTPIIKGIYFLDVTPVTSDTRGSTGDLTFGTFGWCTDSLRIVTWNGTEANFVDKCSSSSLGYQLDRSIFRDVNQVGPSGLNFDLDKFDSSVSEGLTKAMILQPIACALVLLSTIMMVWFFWKPRSRRIEVIALIFYIITFAITWAAFIVSVVVFNQIKRRIWDASNRTLRGEYASGFWINLVAAALYTVSVLASCFWSWGMYNAELHEIANYSELPREAVYDLKKPSAVV